MKRFAQDSQDAPQVSFVDIADKRSILLAGLQTLQKDTLTVQRQTQPVTLYYTVKEWQAFISGVRDGEFDSFVSRPSSDLIPIRDSKDPGGPILVFSAGQIRPFFNAIQSGKYDL